LSDKPAPFELKGFQRKHLRALAHRLKPLVQVGQAGVSPEVLSAVQAALLDHELIKVRLTRPEDKHAEAAALAQGAGAALVGLVGHTAILYKPHPKEPQIKLPTRK